MIERELLNTEQLAERLNLSLSSVFRLARNRVLPRVAARFDWSQVRLVLAKLTVWEIQHEGGRHISGEMLKADQLAARLGFTIHKVRAMVRQRFIPFTRLGPQNVRFDFAAVSYAVDNIISVRECARRLGIPRAKLESMTGQHGIFQVIRLSKRCLRYHWPSVQIAISKASAAATVVKIAA